MMMTDQSSLIALSDLHQHHHDPPIWHLALDDARDAASGPSRVVSSPVSAGGRVARASRFT